MKRILIVDSNIEDATRLQQALELQGHRTARLEDGGQFLSFCQQHMPDLVIVDVDLPVVNGWAAVHGLRADDSTKVIPAIALSAHASAVEAQQAQSIGFQRLVSKPLDMDAMLRCVDEVMNGGVVAGVGLAAADSQMHAPSPNAVVQACMVSVASISDDEDCSFERVSGVTRCIAELIDSLRPNVLSLGSEGPELFGYISEGEKQITAELNAIAARGPEACEHALYDKDLRHDFRNMIGAVTGFSELILMEPGLDHQLAAALAQIRQYSTEFVRLLDAQKAAAAAA